MSGQMDAVVQQIRHLAEGGRASPLTDQQLLERFIARKDESAFAALVRRHGPMILGLCRRVLHHVQDAEDVGQATFLVLARKAAAIRKQESVGSWLYGVAYRLAMKAKTEAAKQRSPRSIHRFALADRAPSDSSVNVRGRALNDKSSQEPDPLSEITWREVCTALDEELARLPDRCRAPLVLCYLQGKTQDEALQQLGWSKSTFRRRLEEGRKKLCGRLTRRGITLSAGLWATLLSDQGASAALSSVLLQSTVQAAIPFAAGQFAGAGISPHVTWLAERALKTAALTKMKWIALLGLATALTTGMGLAAHQALTANPANREPKGLLALADERRAQPEPKKEDQPRLDRYGDPLPEGALLRLGTLRLQQDGDVLALIYSPDGKLLVSAGGERSGFRGPGWIARSFGFIHVWDPLTGKEFHRFEGQEKTVRAIAFAPDGKVLASAGDDKVVLWDIATGKELRRVKPPSNLTMSLAFSADGKLLFTSGPTAENAIFVWNVTSGGISHRLLAPEKGYGMTVVVSPDGKKVAADWNTSSVPLILLWDIESGRLVHQFKVSGTQNTPISSLSFSPDGRLLASGGQDEIIRLWDIGLAQEVRQIATKSGYRVTFSPDGKMLASAGRHGVTLWDASTGQQIRPLRDKLRRPDSVAYEAPPYDCVAFSPDGKTLAWSTDHAIRLLNTSTGEERLSFHRHAAPVKSVAISLDNKTIASAGDRLRLWDAASGEERPVFGNVERVCCVSFSADGKTLIGGSGYQTLHLWDVDSGKELRQFSGEPGIPDLVAFLPDGKSAVSVSRHRVFPIDNKSVRWETEMQARVWDIASGKQIRSIGKVQVYGATLALDGKLFATGSSHWKVQFWDTATGEESGHVEGGPVLLPVLAFSSDGRKVAAAFHGRPAGGLALFERITGEEILQFKGLQGPIGALAASPLQQLLASGGMDGVIRLWDLDSGEMLRQLKGHQGAVLSLAFSSNGEHLISGSRDTTINIWNVRDVLSAPSTKAPQPEEFRHLYAQLLDDAPNASKAIIRLARSGEKSIPFLREQLLSPSFPDERQIGRMIMDLDDDSVMVREKATKELTKLGKYGEPPLRRALENKPSNEVRSRVELVLRRLHGLKPSPDVVRIVRILDILERIGTPEARKLVETILQNTEEPRVISEAKGTLERLKKQSRN
jgi:RNA polymerase sigma factor (sigma-70 family)